MTARSSHPASPLISMVRNDGDARALREALTVLAERQSIGALICDYGGAVIFATPRARRMLSGSSLEGLPLELVRLVDLIAKEGKDETSSKITLDGSQHPVSARAARLSGSPRHVLLTLESEGPRSSLTKNLADTFGLSARSIQLVHLASRGLKNKEIATRLRLSEATIKTYMHALFRELGVRNRAELVALAERMAREDRPDSEGAKSV